MLELTKLGDSGPVHHQNSGNRTRRKSHQDRGSDSYRSSINSVRDELRTDDVVRASMDRVRPVFRDNAFNPNDEETVAGAAARTYEANVRSGANSPFNNTHSSVYSPRQSRRQVTRSPHCQGGSGGTPGPRSISPVTWRRNTRNSMDNLKVFASDHTLDRSITGPAVATPAMPPSMYISTERPVPSRRGSGPGAGELHRLARSSNYGANGATGPSSGSPSDPQPHGSVKASPQPPPDADQVVSERAGCDSL